MKLKEFFYKVLLKPNYCFYESTKSSLGIFKDNELEFYQWNTPKSSKYRLNHDEVKELSSFINDGDIAIDVGAHIGDSSLPIALACGSKGIVIAFEPNPIVFTILTKNSFINRKCTNIYPVPFACLNSEKSLVFKYSDPWLANGGDKTSYGFLDGNSFPLPINGINPVNLIKEIKEQRKRKIKYLKIDVEGQDYYVLKQFEKIIESDRPYIKFEIAKFTNENLREKIKIFFKTKDYELYLVDREHEKLYGKKFKTKYFYSRETIDVFCKPN